VLAWGARTPSVLAAAAPHSGSGEPGAGQRFDPPCTDGASVRLRPAADGHRPQEWCYGSVHAATRAHFTCRVLATMLPFNSCSAMIHRDPVWRLVMDGTLP